MHKATRDYLTIVANHDGYGHLPPSAGMAQEVLDELDRLTAELEKANDAYLGIKADYTTSRQQFERLLKELETKLTAAQKDTERLMSETNEAADLIIPAVRQIQSGASVGVAVAALCEAAGKLRAAIDDSREG